MNMRLETPDVSDEIRVQLISSFFKLADLSQRLTMRNLQARKKVLESGLKTEQSYLL
jgi:hypothetical protein